MSANCATLFSAFVGEAERTMRELFAQARASAPAVIFLDEIDAVVGSRGTTGGHRGSARVQEQILSTLLNELDGVEAADGILLIAATNRLDRVDPALLRPGRLEKIVHVPPPETPDARTKILHICSNRMPLDTQVNLGAIGNATKRWTGAELESLCREAAFCALRDDRASCVVLHRHFTTAMRGITPILLDPVSRQKLHSAAHVAAMCNCVIASGHGAELPYPARYESERIVRTTIRSHPNSDPPQCSTVDSSASGVQVIKCCKLSDSDSV